MHNNIPETVAMIIAGGQSRRLQLNSQYKWQLPFGNETLLDFVGHRLEEQLPKTNSPSISVNLPSGVTLENARWPLVYDSPSNVAGPLSGIYTALQWAHHRGAKYVLTLPCDSPFFPSSLLSIFEEQLTEGKAVIAADNQCWHPVFGLWPTSLFLSVEEYIANCDNFALKPLVNQFAQVVNFNNEDNDLFFNINTYEDYQQALTIKESLWPDCKS